LGVLSHHIEGPVEQPGRARHPVKVEVAGSNPVRTAKAPATALGVASGRPGQVAQVAEHAAENRGVGGSSPSLATNEWERENGARAGRRPALPT
jgi:hypothetical protein